MTARLHDLSMIFWHSLPVLAAAPHGDAVDVRVSSFCSGGGCVGVAGDELGVVIVDTKSGASPQLRFSRREWSAFVSGVKNGEIEFDQHG